ncbi:MAG: amino acid permease [Pseudobdellovibrionaceae bacterium]|nr:amino acid permease [Bdellovibrionales bacterium]USN47928.1 MAG: amino acid permease [Pseudobdellovibrionaceae bacterium]
MKKLQRSLGLSSVISICTSSALGSGLFILPAIAIVHTGSSAWLAFFVAGLSVLPAALSKAELATAMPESGGTYIYLERTFGPLAGTVAGLGVYLVMLLKSAFALVGFGAYLSVIASLPLLPTAMGLLVVILALNVLGVGKVGGVLVVSVIISITGLFILATGASFSVRPELLEPFFANGLGEFIYVIALVFVSYAGITKIAAVAEEVKQPGRNIPRGILLSLLLIMVLYSVVNFVLAGNIPQKDFVGDLKPIYSLAERLGGSSLGVVFSVLGVVTMTSMANAGVLAASRFPFAMSRDQLLPDLLGRLHERFMTPIWSILLSGLVVAAAILTMDVEGIAKFASAFILLLFLLENVVVIVLRETRVQWYKPEYKSPLYPWMQLVGIVSGIAIMAAMGLTVLLAVVSISVPGLILYAAFSRLRTDRKGVLGFRGRRKDLVDVDATPKPRHHVEVVDLSVDASVVVALFGKEKTPEVLTELGVVLAGGGKVEVAYLTELPEQTVLDDLDEDTPVIRSLRRRLLAMAEKENVEMSFDPIVTHDLFKSINDISQRLHSQWLVVEWAGKGRGAFTFHNPMGWLQDHLSCNLVTVRDRGVRYYRKILVALKGTDVDRFVIDTARQYARAFDAEITFCRYVDSPLSEEGRARENEYLEKFSKYCRIDAKTMICEGDNEVDQLVAASIEYDLLILANYDEPNRLKRIFGTAHDEIMSQVACTAISIKAPK